MRRRFHAPTSWLLLLLALPAAASGAKLAPELEARLATVAASERVPILVILHEQADPAALTAETLGLARSARRAVAGRALRSVAGRSQGPVIAALEAAAGRNEARPPVSLWLLNAVRTSATPAVIDELSRLGEVRRILWDPSVPVEEQIDVAGGGRSAGAFARSTPAAGGLAWHLDFIRAPQAWSQGYDGTGVLVGIVDTGVDYNHPDLAGHMWVNEDEIADNDVDDDLNGFIDDVIGWDFVNDDNDPIGTGPGDHGTQVAGMVVGDGTGGTATGVAPGAVIMPVRGSGGTWGDLIEALQYAVDNGVDIITMSITQKWRNSPKPDYAAWRTIADNELALGILHANSIGNEGDNFDTDPVPFNVAAPGNCPAPWVHGDQWLVGGASGIIGVGSVDSLRNVFDTSSRGPSAWEDIGLEYPEYPYEMPPEYQDYPHTGGKFGLIKPDIVAPGPETISTAFGGGYAEFSGTSASTPQVAGAMAILLQARPATTPEHMAMMLMSSADDRGPAGKDNGFGAGILDVEAALEKALSWNSVSRIEGMVVDDATLEPVPGAAVALVEAGLQTTSRSDGSYVFCVPQRLYVAWADEFFHEPDTLLFFAAGGDFAPQDLSLVPLPLATLLGTVTDFETGNPIPGVRIFFPGTPVPMTETGLTGAYGVPQLPAGRSLEIHAARFGHVPGSAEILLAEGANVQSFALDFGVRDDFEIFQGWTVGVPGDDATEGFWERIDPVATFDGEIMVQPEDDATPDPGTLAFVTGASLAGASDDWGDVDDGRTTLMSPVFSATRFDSPRLQMMTWYSNDTGFQTDDVFTVEISSDGGGNWTILETYDTSHRFWMQSGWDLDDFVEATPLMRIRIVAEDTGADSAVEVAVDDVEVFESTSAVGDLLVLDPDRLALQASPNPFNPRTVITLRLPRGERAVLEIIGVDGRRVAGLWNGPLPAGVHAFAWGGETEAGSRAATGHYFARLAQGKDVRTLRLLLLK